MIVPLCQDHIVPCARIMAENPLWQRYHVTQSSAESQFRDGLDTPEAQIDVSLDDDRVTGFIWYYLHGTFHQGGYIRLIGVDVDYQGQGVGSDLIKTAETKVMAHTPHLFLLASDFNEQAHQFYDRLGYHIIGELPDFAQDGISEMIFYKRLT